jgi:hypothetical protein
MKPIPALQRLRTMSSDDSRIAKFYLLFKNGQNAAFSIPFNKLSLFIKAVKDVTRQMASRLFESDLNSQLEIMDGLADPVSITGITSGRDEVTGDKLLWVETETDGHFAFHLTTAMQQELMSHLTPHQEEPVQKNDHVA